MLNDCDFYYVSNVGVCGETWGEAMERMTWRFEEAVGKLTDGILDIPTYLRNAWCECGEPPQWIRDQVIEYAKYEHEVSGIGEVIK